MQCVMCVSIDVSKGKVWCVCGVCGKKSQKFGTCLFIFYCFPYVPSLSQQLLSSTIEENRSTCSCSTGRQRGKGKNCHPTPSHSSICVLVFCSRRSGVLGVPTLKKNNEKNIVEPNTHQVRQTEQ